MTRIVLVLLALLALGAAPTDAGPPRPRSPLILPDQQIPLRFLHDKHLALGAQCQLCHSTVATSRSALDRNVPDHTTCAICHRMELPQAGEMYPKSACTTCHPGHDAGAPSQLDARFQPLPEAPRPPVLDLPPARLLFPHATHVDAGVPCLDCHVGIDKTELATRDHLPTMYQCLGCHDGRKAPDACTTCHLQEPGGGLLTELEAALPLKPSGRFRPDDHQDPEWSRLHEHAAKSDPRQCEACHEPRDCLDCHDGVQKPAIHSGDWQMTHGLEAMRRDPDCSACHERSFCQDCHESAKVRPGLFPGTQADPPGDRRFHPEGWAGVIGEIAGPEHHSHTARRSLDTCTACHAEADCVDCHSFVNPHGERFTDAPEGWRYGAGGTAVCATCHLPGDPNREPGR